MTDAEQQEIWNYYKVLEDDLAFTARYVEPREQEEVYSLEFLKLLILSCTEAESLFKMLCSSICKNLNCKNFDCKVSDVGKISDYKKIILKGLPYIITLKVDVPRLGRNIIPFDNWDKKPLLWWHVYQEVKHNRRNSFKEANYINTCTALAAVHILILCLFQIENHNACDYQGEYIKNPYYNISPILGTDPKSEEFPDSDIDETKETD